MRNLSDIIKSLEEETRLRIMALLLDVEELCVCDIMTVLQLPQSTVSRHLSNLKNAGWISDRRAGVWIYYSLAEDLSPIHKKLAAALRTIFIKNETAAKDRKRLMKHGRKDCCT
jgi:ArsR family transcriptional regulator